VVDPAAGGPAEGLPALDRARAYLERARYDRLLYRDLVGYENGVTRIQYSAGDAGKGKAALAAANFATQGHEHLPIGVAADLSGNTSPTLQLVTTEGFCLGATINKVIRDDGVAYGAITK